MSNNIDQKASPARIHIAAILDRASALYRQRVGWQFLLTMLVHLVWALLMVVLWVGFVAILPVLNERGGNAMVDGLYAVGVAMGITAVLWLMRRVALIASAGSGRRGRRIFPAVTAGLAEILCDCVLYGAMGYFVFQRLGGLGWVLTLAIEPTMKNLLPLLMWLAPCVLIAFFWMTLKLLAIPVAMREKRHFLAAVARAVRVALTKRMFWTLLLVQLFMAVLSVSLASVGYILMSKTVGVPSFFGEMKGYIAPIWHLLLAYLLTIPLSPFYSLLHEACADAASMNPPTCGGTAGFGARTAAFLLDVVIFVGGIAGLLLAVLLPMTGGKLGMIMAKLNGAAGGILVALLALCVLLLYAAVEAIGRGQTPGKRMMRLRAVAADGTGISFGQAYLRGILRVVDVCLVGGLCVFFGQNKTRLGDMAAGTRVVYDAGK